VVAVVVTTAIGFYLGRRPPAAPASTLMLTLTYGVIAYYFFSQVTRSAASSPIGASAGTCPASSATS
jgi:hypothetical protein